MPLSTRAAPSWRCWTRQKRPPIASPHVAAFSSSSPLMATISTSARAAAKVSLLASSGGQGQFRRSHRPPP
eukprot:7602917-Pyramimonas_sp.AAC.1